MYYFRKINSGKLMKKSRSKKAQAIHTLLFDILKDKKNINDFKNALTEATDEV